MQIVQRDCNAEEGGRKQYILPKPWFSVWEGHLTPADVQWLLITPEPPTVECTNGCKRLQWLVHYSVVKTHQEMVLSLIILESGQLSSGLKAAEDRVHLIAPSFSVRQNHVQFGRRSRSNNKLVEGIKVLWTAEVSFHLQIQKTDWNSMTWNISVTQHGGLLKLPTNPP